MLEYNKKVIRKSGRTLIIRTSDILSIEGLDGLLQNNDLQNGKYFLVFDTIDNAVSAFKILKNNNNFNVRFAYYRVFFTMSGIDANSDYSQLKKLHSDWITQNTGAEVLYYKQYMKDNKFIGCGDFTIDTKESMDKLLNKDEFKNYTIDTLSGTYYRYNKKTDQKSNEYTFDANV